MDCLNCGGELFKHDSCELSDNDECMEIECIAEASHYNEVWYYCEKCSYFYLECPSCSHPCNITNYPSYDIHGEKVDASQKDLNIPYIDTSKWRATGPDGGMKHTWECTKCDFEKSYSDK